MKQQLFGLGNANTHKARIRKRVELRKSKKAKKHTDSPDDTIQRLVVDCWRAADRRPKASIMREEIENLPRDWNAAKDGNNEWQFIQYGDDGRT